jgi:hypothetical protein
MGFLKRSSSENGHFGSAQYTQTEHAGIRVQQRGVDRRVLACLLAFGHHETDHKGCQVVTFGGLGLDELAGPEYRPAIRRSSDYRNLYAVVDSTGVVIASGHRFRRVQRDLSLSSFRPGRSRGTRALNSQSNHH